ncbi:hypothetical protein L248_1523 [Schleiferilactobacillus shenzhenensis LY-73]|uniref:Uncharacterized protein n=1 Tax=Schleiferilactobacillus shenzhenensis LY-73 TaxID=1231336 RepID=U4TRM7_9LACO|nr:hypothetical protein L248_1523 [Schleiferilactobacillus shenzhenensis LY-73]
MSADRTILALAAPSQTANGFWFLVHKTKKHQRIGAGV